MHEHPRRPPWWAHVGALALLALVTWLRFHPQLTSAGARTDERVYLRAFAAAAAGRSPYAPAPDGLDFYYPPTFAALGAAALEGAGERAVVLALRTLNVLGLAACLWGTLYWARCAWRWRLTAAALYVALAPPALVHGFRSGNLSFAVVGSCLLGLAVWPRAPASAGALLALSSAVKPLAPVGLAVLAVHRGHGSRRPQLVAAATGAALAAALVVNVPFLAEYLSLDGDLDALPLRRSVSLHRWLHLAGIALPPLVTIALVAAGALWLASRREVDPRRLVVLAIPAMTLAAPALWSHTLLLTLPLQAMALGRAWRRRRSGTAAAARRARYELVLVALAATALQLADGIGGGIETAPRVLQALALAVPVAAPPALAAYLWSEEDEASASQPFGR